MRLEAVQSAIQSLEDMPPATELPRLVADRVRSESAVLQSQIDELEDRSRGDNPIFYGIADDASETWQQSEFHIRELLSKHLKLQIPDSVISRAHRIGTFAQNRNRPIIMKFACFKTKDKILSQKAMLKGTRVFLGKDFCRSTRLTRKKLIKFGKASGPAYSLHFNKFVMSEDKKNLCLLLSHQHYL